MKLFSLKEKEKEEEEEEEIEKTPEQEAEEAHNKEVEEVNRIAEQRDEIYKTKLNINLQGQILKMNTVFWPGGALMQNPSVDGSLMFWGTVGLCHPNMPNTFQVSDLETEYDEQDRPIRVRCKVTNQEDPLRVSPALAGYGIEILVTSKADDPFVNTGWPIVLLQSLVETIFNNKWDLYTQIRKLGSVTYRDVNMGKHLPEGKASFLLSPLDPKQFSVEGCDFKLDNGKLKILVASFITQDELEYAYQGEGAKILLKRFKKLDFDHYQISAPGRKSALK